jgi:hypothetical protein
MVRSKKAATCEPVSVDGLPLGASKSIQNLIAALAFAVDSKSADESLKYERARYIHALGAISKFLHEVGAGRYKKRLYRLDDLNRGTVDQLLKEVETGGTKKLNASWTWCARAHVSLGIFALLKSGLTREAAAQKAACEFPKIEKLAALSRKSPTSTATKILSWFDDFNKGSKSKIKNRQALAIFADGQQLIEKLVDVERLHKVATVKFTSALE